MTVDTPFLLASVTKLYIAAVVLKLWERGHLDLYAPISSYLPGELGRGLHVLDGVDHTWMPGAQPLEPTGDPATIWVAGQPVDRPLALQSFRDLYATVIDVLGSAGRCSAVRNAQGLELPQRDPIVPWR